MGPALTVGEAGQRAVPFSSIRAPGFQSRGAREPTMRVIAAACFAIFALAVPGAFAQENSQANYETWPVLRSTFPSTGGGGIMIKGYDPVITGGKCVTTFMAVEPGAISSSRRCRRRAARCVRMASGAHSTAARPGRRRAGYSSRMACSAVRPEPPAGRSCLERSMTGIMMREEVIAVLRAQGRSSSRSRRGRRCASSRIAGEAMICLRASCPSEGLHRPRPC
jgi:hypothetical protein